MFNVGAGELVVILIAALLILGPKRLPELARGLGKFLHEFRRQTDEVKTMVEREFYQMDQDLHALPSTEISGVAEGGPAAPLPAQGEGGGDPAGVPTPPSAAEPGANPGASIEGTPVPAEALKATEAKS
jgi:sec-independent protein translocase protein TatB